MKRIILLAAVVAAFAVGAVAADVGEFTFDRTQSISEWRVPITDLSPGVPADWPDGSFLVLELRASSSQRFDLRIYTGQGYSRVRLHPYPGVWVRAALPVAVLSKAPGTGNDMAAVGNRSRTGYYMGLWGPFVPARSVQAIGFVMEHAVGSPRLEIRSIRVVKESPGDAVLDEGPVADEFGQHARSEWSGKAKDLNALRQAWSADVPAAKAGVAPPCSFGGYAEAKQTYRATGFFRVEKASDGRWWFIDPDGHPFLSAGADVMTPWMETPSEGRAGLFAALPPSELRSGRRRGGEPGVSFLTWNVFRRYGSGWLNQWVEATLRRMDAWGLNTVANWSHAALWDAKKKPYTVPLGRWETSVTYLGLPDVHSADFERNADNAARAQCEPRKSDPWLLGYFLANEPPFPQKTLQTAELILSGPDTATQRELRRWLAAGDTPERRTEFVDRALERYVRVTSEAVRRHDPNHLNLGMRSGGSPTDAEIRAAGSFDVYSVNIYDYEVKPERVRRISDLTGKPVLIGEFHFGTPGRGLAASLVQVKDAAERGTAYRYYVENAFSMPEMIGTHWFQWSDQPCTGRYDGENYNIGLVDVTDRPYSELVDALKATHARLFQVHGGSLAPFNRRPTVN
jgi:hypothetical protein